MSCCTLLWWGRIVPRPLGGWIIRKQELIIFCVHVLDICLLVSCSVLSLLAAIIEDGRNNTELTFANMGLALAAHVIVHVLHFWMRQTAAYAVYPKREVWLWLVHSALTLANGMLAIFAAVVHKNLQSGGPSEMCTSRDCDIALTHMYIGCAVTSLLSFVTACLLLCYKCAA